MRFQDETFRGVVLASMNMMSNAVNAWWSIIFYGAIHAPYFTVSFPTIQNRGVADMKYSGACGR